MEKKHRALQILISTVGIPLLFFAMVEIGLRLARVNTEIVKSKSMKIVTPVWAANDINFFAADSIYQGIIANAIPAHAADWMRYFEEAPGVGYRMKPNLQIRIFNTVNKREIKKGHTIFIRSNSRGFRSPEITKKKGPGVFRIVFLGDSSTFGWGVNQDERFSDLLEKRLNGEQNRLRYETINLGIPGYTSLHGLHAFTRFALPYSPDLVICSFGANDGKPISRKGKKMLQKENRLEWLRFFLLKFKTYQLLRKWMMQLANPFDPTGKPQDPGETEPVATPAEFRQHLETLIRTAREHHAKVAFLPLCCPLPYWQTMAWAAKKNALPFIDGMDILLRGVFAVRAGERYPEMAEAVREIIGEKILAEVPMFYTTSDTCHPNAIGHCLLADALYEKLFSPSQKQHY